MKQELSSLISKDCVDFLSLPGERVLVAIRKHPATVITTFIALAGYGLLFFLAGFYFFFVLLSSWALFISFSFVVVIFILSLSIRSILEWYLHFYIATDKKLLEIRYMPLASCNVNEVLMDQVKCTEIDMKTIGLFSAFFDIGTVSFAFDRPTQQDAFILESIGNPRDIASFLSSHFLSQKSNSSMPVTLWYRPKNLLQAK